MRAHNYDYYNRSPAAVEEVLGICAGRMEGRCGNCADKKSLDGDWHGAMAVEEHVIGVQGLGHDCSPAGERPVSLFLNIYKKGYI